ncbi:MAG: hypothetical protein OEZ43_18430 [Gammaproteobacteria bacterium]|nr:hypothetical protein [Gammaproteobacteria bacterium]
MKSVFIAFYLLTIASFALADSTSPYVGQEQREIKALSPQEVEGYLTGKGLGYAKAAELNHYPGPKHVLEIAQDLALTEMQITQTQAIFDEMQTKAVDLGKQLVDKEKSLDQLFANGAIDAKQLNTLVSAIGELQAKIRYVHLQAHLKQKTVLNQHQIHRYDQIRGYGAQGSGHEHSHFH